LSEIGGQRRFNANRSRKSRGSPAGEKKCVPYCSDSCKKNISATVFFKDFTHGKMEGISPKG
jgi:hypothetical protein